MITQEKIKELFDYDSGNLLRKTKTSNRVKVGDVVGSISKSGYIKTGIDNKTHLVHRLIWIWHNGEIDNNLLLDHINQDKVDNRIENLRLVNRQENSWNRQAKGAYFDKRCGLWQSKIQTKSGRISLGYFDTEEKAHDAYINAKNKYHVIEQRK